MDSIGPVGETAEPPAEPYNFTLASITARHGFVHLIAPYTYAATHLGYNRISNTTSLNYRPGKNSQAAVPCIP